MVGHDRSLDLQFDRSGPNLTVYVSGEIDIDSAPVLTAQVLRRCDASLREVWLDLSAVTYCDSAGLGSFAEMHRHVTDLGGRLVLYQPQQLIGRILAITQLDSVIPVLGRRSLGPLGTNPAPPPTSGAAPGTGQHAMETDGAA